MKPEPSPSSENRAGADSRQVTELNLFFRLAAFSAAMFVVTVLALIATMFGNPHAPLNQFLDQYGGILIAVEVTGSLLLGVLAMTIDRRRILRQLQESKNREDSGEISIKSFDENLPS